MKKLIFIFLAFSISFSQDCDHGEEDIVTCETEEDCPEEYYCRIYWGNTQGQCLSDCYPADCDDESYENTCETDADCSSGSYCSEFGGTAGTCLLEACIENDLDNCGGYYCLDDGDGFYDYCLDGSQVPALCGECLDDSWCEAAGDGWVCSYASDGTECGYSTGTLPYCNECVKIPDVTLSISAIEDDGAGNVVFDIYMKNEVPVAGFQFRLDTDPTDVLSFLSFCSDDYFTYKSLCISNGKCSDTTLTDSTECISNGNEFVYNSWYNLAAPHSGRADTSNFTFPLSRRGNIFGFSISGDSIDIGEGILTKVPVFYNPDKINSFSNINFDVPSFSTIGCEGSGKLSIFDVILVRNISLELITPTEEQKECADINGDGNIDIFDILSMVDALINNVEFNLDHEIIFSNTAGEPIQEVEFISQTWLVGTGIGIYGCVDDTANNYNPEANIDDGSCVLAVESPIIQYKYKLLNIYPNPFNPITNITYALPENSHIELMIYDITGRQIETLVSGFQMAGYHSINWDASPYPSGVYLIRMDSGDFTQIQKVVLVK